MTEPSSPPKLKRVLELAFPGYEAPPQLSASVVSLVELCQLAMPDAIRIRELILGAGFEIGAQTRADEAGRTLAFDIKAVDMPVRNLRHEIFGRGRDGEPVILLLSQGDTGTGSIVFLSAVFRGAVEADAIKAAMHVVKAQPLTGAKIRNHDGNEVRRVFWDVAGVAGLRGFMVSGPQDTDSVTLTRAFTGFNWVSP